MLTAIKRMCMHFFDYPPVIQIIVDHIRALLPTELKIYDLLLFHCFSDAKQIVNCRFKICRYIGELCNVRIRGCIFPTADCLWRNSENFGNLLLC